MPIGADAPVLTLQEAAARLDVSVEQMLAWNMVIIHEIDGCERVPAWSADPRIARYLPMLSQLFQGEALTYCLSQIRPLGDGRDGLDALRDGHWHAVLERLQVLRAKLDRALRRGGPGGAAASGWMGRHAAAPAPVTLH